MHGLFLSYITFWTTFAPRVLFLQIVKGTWIRVCKAFSRFEIFSPCLKSFSFDFNKTPPKRDPPLRVQEGFDIFFLKYYFLPLLNTIGYQLKILLEKLSFWNWWWCGPFALGSYSLPLWHESPKTESLEPLELLSPPLVINKWVKIIPKSKSFALDSPPKDVEMRGTTANDELRSGSLCLRRRLQFPFNYTYDLVWNRLKNTLVIAYERDMIKGI